MEINKKTAKAQATRIIQSKINKQITKTKSYTNKEHHIYYLIYL